MVSVRTIVPAVLLLLAHGDAFFLPLYRDRPTSMACRWYNMPAYSTAIPANNLPTVVGGTAGGSGALGSLNGLVSMLSQLYPESIVGPSQTRPRVVVRVEETDFPGGTRNQNQNQPAVGTVPSLVGNANRELDYYDPDAGYYYEDDGYYYDDYSAYADTVTYYEMPAANVRAPGNIFQTWYGNGFGGSGPAGVGAVDACSVCASNAMLSFLMG